jgi:nitrite reductase (NADH) small subunit
MIERGKVVCPWHGWAWDLKTGEAVQNPSMKVAVYPLKIESGDVLVEV